MLPYFTSHFKVLTTFLSLQSFKISLQSLILHLYNPWRLPQDLIWPPPYPIWVNRERQYTDCSLLSVKKPAISGCIAFKTDWNKLSPICSWLIPIHCIDTVISDFLPPLQTDAGSKRWKTSNVILNSSCKSAFLFDWEAISKDLKAICRQKCEQ